MTELEQRVTELETKIAFQDETIDILNDELKMHQQALAKIQRQTELLAEKFKEVQPPEHGEPTIEPPPPHY